ncbi:hypothetical protein MSM1_13785 [Mycobacterium sp. SM1]|uniref:hypothetical protein n=1 Tax=Mycobacterium sp. SM1 TaxID=2816243 RepID=UPI001BCE51F2|nr:hypothetical protein [Mycobacterium sp. SM1]MBS4729362.1 hypothetical protein [Mycobacterium sp. SM1]
MIKFSGERQRSFPARSHAAAPDAPGTRTERGRPGPERAVFADSGENPVGVVLEI